ncbi:hypothetical protein HMPREF9504_02563 [Enterococcus faecalis TX0102]|uniref:hypothetical protein n=1 Tax=Enterococcus faecalis TaxID=1351 RepID=UPI0001E71788|nr:hypothetical protein [Enterococcus faecalis]EFQ11956.1 hypothetical protein HMPREF9504_02563 [Enterococcus faecalis TX0102]EFT96147.1 hypothetical protein HMPREF9502_02549 [Enterococcus faecalis TX0031]EOJ68425.1 hypothetical protein WMW_01881 [Enterococcus faecalis EnGen0352]MDI7831933.1 hypothetical protein [Enterococcus faecalis]NSS19302.1 hypothetical protein [Enterococcus faecalis]
MDPIQEKEIIYTLMQNLILERRELNKQYYSLKERLDTLNNQNIEDSKSKVVSSSKKETHQNYLKREIEYQKYKLSLGKNKTLPRDKISTTICSILKESGVPLNTKQIYHTLINDFQIYLTYQNLAHNILPKATKEKNLNIERAYRGYYQYHQK